jgi:acyl transferase domain-containing protein/thioesterase domain-containing protein/acyl carrier protein
VKSSEDIAIVGIALRLPGGIEDAEGYWGLLREGSCAIRKLERGELEAAGVPPHLIGRPDYVPYAAPLDRFDHFDADFFGLSPKEAGIMDPQHRLVLELSWEALEKAGHVPSSFPGKIGVFAGCGMGSYFYFNVCSNPDLVEETGMFLLRHTGNDKDFLSTRVSHALDLKGPSVNIQTACSTSLVAIHYAAEALRAGECDIALAGGSTVELPQGHGYLYKENEILSPDGQCRAFDHRAQGTVFGSGAGVVALRRLSDALRDGDPIIAVLKGSAINNDGADKAGYLAPSVSGQAEAIALAQEAAGTPAETIDYVECHGTGTYLGDPIEIAALTEAFRRTTERADFCRIGSVKTNIGHLDTAAGVASIAKAALAVQHAQMPPSLGYEAPNPAIPFDGSPFRVNDRLSDWPKTGRPRRAAVNSLGVGGTNAHAIIEEAPAPEASEDSGWPFQLLTLSARTDAALDAASERLATYLETNQTEKLADIAFTLKEGRHGFEKRRVVVAETHAEAAALLRENDPRKVFTHTQVGEDPAPVFMFPGGGAQYAGMARDLYETEPVFRDWMDRGLAILQPKIDYDVRAIWLPEPDQIEAADARLKTPSVQLPLIMIVEYALAQLWMSWGVKPAALIGHSMGENTAACLAGVMSFEDCIGLVHLRGTLFDCVPAGGMLSVALSEEDLIPYLSNDLDIASINAPALTVATGPDAALEALAKRLAKDDIDNQRIAIDIAAHSRMLEPILQPFADYLRSIELHAPKIPFVSNRTGDWITDDEATDPDYWVRHLRGTVRFIDGIGTLAENTDRIYIEVGPGRAMATLSAQHPLVRRTQVVNSLRDPREAVPDDAYFVSQLGRVWATGGTFDWSQLWEGARRRRVDLPTYPFQRKQYFIAPGTAQVRDISKDWPMRIEDPEKWGWKPFWKPTYADCLLDVTGDLRDAPHETWLIFLDDTGLGDALTERLRGAGHHVTTVRPGDIFARMGEDSYIVAPELEDETYNALLADLSAHSLLPTRIVHLWMVTGDEKARPGSSFFHRVQEQGFWSLYHLARAWASVDGGHVHINVVTSDASEVRGGTLRYPEKTTIQGPARVIPREFPEITVSLLDIAGPARRGAPPVDAVLEECLATPANLVAAHAGGKRFEQTWVPMRLDNGSPVDIREGAVILMTGGLGGIGLTLAERLARDYGAKIAFTARSKLPPRPTWDSVLARKPANNPLARRLNGLLAVERAGGQVMTLAADVSNPEDMQAAVEKITAAWGPISGVIHAAGTMDDAPILAKTAPSMDAVLAAKVHGTKVLTDLFPDGSLDWMALFSSVSTITAPAGQVDYVAANAYLNAVAHARAGGKTRVVAIDWGVWSGIGMASDAMEARLRDDEPVATPIRQPLLDGLLTDASGNRQFRAAWRARDRWVIDEHRTRAGDALLPGTGYFEIAAEVLSAQDHDCRFEIGNLTFLSPLRVPDDGGTTVRITLPRSQDGLRLKVESALDGKSFETNALAELWVGPMERPAPLDIDAISARCSLAAEAPAGEALLSPQDAHLAFGPRWRVLKSTRFGDGEGIAHLAAAGADTAYQLNPALLDIATGWAMDLIDGYEGTRLWVPVSYDRARFYGPLPKRIVSWVRLDRDGLAVGSARFDITLAAPDGEVCAEFTGFSVHRLDGGIRFGAAPARKVEASGRKLSPAEERLHHIIGQGIPPEAGAGAFLAALGSGLPQIAVTSLDLPALVTQAGADSRPRRQTGTFERPDLDSDYVEPEGEIERRLAAFWTELLGIDKVGAEDNFFDLGGHSLIAVRLFAQVKSVFAVDFPISILFEAPTIRKCAALIAERGVAPQSDAPKGAAPMRKAERRFTHIVPMHHGEPGTRTPFFLVAGMFGNVLNLRHLAHLVGTDRPFYGLQARGLFGGDEPHNDLVEAARDYIAEIREVQPHGPYMLGGFSGGGLTAYEIARQLRDADEEVTALVLLDTPLPQRRQLTRRDRWTIHWLNLRQQGASYVTDWLRGKIEYRRRMRDKAAYETSTTEFHNKDIEAAFYEAIARYELKPWDGPITLFRPPLDLRYRVGPDRWVNARRELVDEANDWRPYAPKLVVFEVPGNHDSMVLEPNVRILSVRMKKVIEAAEPDRPAHPALRAAE